MTPATELVYRILCAAPGSSGDVCRSGKDAWESWEQANRALIDRLRIPERTEQARTVTKAVLIAAESAGSALNADLSTAFGYYRRKMWWRADDEGTPWGVNAGRKLTH